METHEYVRLAGDAYTSTGAWDLLADLVDVNGGNRMAGQNGEREAAELMRAAFEARDFDDVQVDEFDIGGWWRGSTSLELTTPSERSFDDHHEIIALPATPACGLDAELVDLGVGTPRDFESTDVAGKIVLVGASDDIPKGYDRRFHRTEKYERAVDGGATGFLYWAPLEGALPSTGWVKFTFDDVGEIPACGVSREVAARLQRYCAAGEVQATLDIDCENAPTTSQNVEASIGPDTDQEILLTAHHDAHDIGEGAADNGTGCALVAEIGRLLTAFEDDLETRVRVISFGAEEAGSLGAKHWVRTHDPDAVKCIVNLDGIGESRTLNVVTCGFDALDDVYTRVGDNLDIPIETDPSLALFADQWPFVERGIPGLEAMSVRTDDDRRWGLGRLWSHTDGDTFDKLDARDLRDLAVPLAASIIHLADSDIDIPHKFPDEIRADVDPGSEELLRTTNRWPWD